MASTSPSKLSPALVSWLSSFSSSLPSLSELDDQTGKPKRVLKASDGLCAALKDGVVLGEVLAEVDPAYFTTLSTSSSSSKVLSDNWVLRFNSLKRLYKLLIRYFEDVLNTTTLGLGTPNLQLIARGGIGDEEEGAKLAGLVLALVVQSEKKEKHIERIQSLDEWAQRELMVCIEQTMSKIVPKPSPLTAAEDNDEDTEFYTLQHERSKLLNEKETIQIVYENLVKDFQGLKSDHEEALASLSRMELELSNLQSQESGGSGRNEEIGLRKELERVGDVLSKVELELNESERQNEKKEKEVEELKKKVEQLQPLALESTKLKDQLDEFKHNNEKYRKMENVVEKYKKKLEEGADLRRGLKTLEDQNSELLDKNSDLTEELTKLQSSKSLVDSYKSRLEASESKSNKLVLENEGLKFDLVKLKEEVKFAVEEKESDREAIGLFQERVKELELVSGRRRESTIGVPSIGEEGISGELEDAETFGGGSTTTMTDLKLKIRQLERELKKGGHGDAEKIAVLENLVEDSKREKERLEKDYLGEHRKNLVLGRRLQEIESGQGRKGDGPEANMALRIRLNEASEELEKVKKEKTVLDVKFEEMEREFIIAKADLNLVNKDQLDILSSLRASLSTEKTQLAKEVNRLKEELGDEEGKGKRLMSQVNTLLMEKADLQSDGIERRERMIERERDFGDLRASIGKSGSEEERARLEELQGENSVLTEKLQKAKAFIKQQDKLFKEAHASESGASFEEAEQGYKSQISTLTEELERQKSINSDVEARYRREQQLMLSAWHDLGMKRVREKTAAGSGGGKVQSQPASWLNQQRVRANGRGLRSA